jgi:hypothetical protein
LDLVWEVAVIETAVLERPAFEAPPFEAEDFAVDALAVPVFEVAAAWGTGLAFAPVALAVFFCAAVGCWPDAAAASASAAIDIARKRNFSITVLVLRQGSA